MDRQTLATLIQEGSRLVSGLMHTYGVRRPKVELITPEITEARQEQERVTTDETVQYQRREIAKELILLEGHLQQGCRINSKPCDCLVPGQGIYTENGMMPIENILASTALTHTGEIRSITQRFQRDHKGGILQLRVNHTNVPLLITPEHPVYAVEDAQKPNWKLRSADTLLSRLDWIPAKYLTTHSALTFPRLTETVDLPEISEDMAELLGWYVSEGSLDKQNGYRITFSLGKKEKAFHDDITQLISRITGSPVHRYERETGLHLAVSDRSIYKLCQSFGFGARKKIMPTWFLKISKEKQWRFLLAAIWGDGWIAKKGYGIGYTTTSESLAVGFRVLLYRLGLIHTLGKAQIKKSFIDGRAIIPNGARWDIIFHGEAARQIRSKMGRPYNPSHHTNIGLITDDYILMPLRAINSVQYEGPVFNIAVQGDESYITIHGALHNCCEKHPIKLEGLAQETAGMTPEPVFRELAAWIKMISPITSEAAAASGKYDAEYPGLAIRAREFRKAIMPVQMIKEVANGPELPTTEEGQ